MVTGANDSVENYADLFTIALRNDDIQEFDSKWDGILLSMTKIPSDDILEGLYKSRIRESAQFKTVLELYDMEIHQRISVPNYQKLKTMVKRSVDQKLRLRNSDARHGRIETGAVIKNGKGKVALKEEKVSVTSGRKKASVRKETDAVSATKPKIVRKKPEHTAATPSEPTVSRGRSVSRKRSIRGKSNHGSFLRQPCRCCLRGTCTRTSCEHWHPPECQFCENETGCKAGGEVFVPASQG